ncbi:MAG: NAD(P)-dependent oxidoreductase [Chloroflexota bacterium]|nr:NAD(P)-dependent oxidoreductase [Chloroflexota bacterium]
MLCRDAPGYLYAQHRRRWRPHFHKELAGQTVGIIGLGNVGTDLARKCKAFHMRVLGMRRSMTPWIYAVVPYQERLR